jgi:hypothetical protein
VLAQTDADSTDYRFPVAFTGPALEDLHLSVKCKAVSGRRRQLLRHPGERARGQRSAVPRRCGQAGSVCNVERQGAERCLA